MIDRIEYLTHTICFEHFNPLDDPDRDIEIFVKVYGFGAHEKSIVSILFCLKITFH